MPPPNVVPLSAAPLYVQIKDTLRARILDGTYAPHSRMPSEHELCAMFDVSRITVRQALGDLQKEGLLFKLHGKGTFVSKPKAFQNVTSLQGFAEAMSSMGYEIVNQLRSLRTVKADRHLATKLNVPEGAPLVEIHRVRLLNREPVSLEQTWVPEALGKRLAGADLATRDIFLILENDCGIPLGHADVSIDAILADDEIVDALHDDPVAAAVDAAVEHRDEHALAAGLAKRRAVQRAGEIGHRAEVELAGDHLVGQRRAGREVLPLHVVLHVLVLAGARQVLVEQMQFADQQAAGRAVDRRVLRADRDADRLRMRETGGRDRERRGEQAKHP